MASSSRQQDRRRPRNSGSGPAELNHRRVPPGAVPNGTVPPGATRSPSAASSHANNYSQRTLDALLSAPERESQPHLHPRKLNGALWFGIDPSVYKFVRTTWQSNFMGPWKNWSDVPEDRQETWWHTFVQHYYWEARFHDIVYFHWKKETMTSIGDRISKKKGKNKKPKYIGETDWDFLMEYWDTEPAQKKSKSAAGCRMSDPLNKGIHKHCAGPRAFARIEYQMMVESGLDEPPPFTDLVRRTHTRKDGTFMDARSESIVLEVEEAAKQVMEEDDSLDDQTASSGGLPSRLVLNKEYLKRGKSKRGYIYGLGSVQYREINPSEKVAVAMSRNLDNEMRIYGLEKNNEALKETNEALKENMVELKSGMGTILCLSPSDSSSSPSDSSSSPSDSIETFGVDGLLILGSAQRGFVKLRSFFGMDSQSRETMAALDAENEYMAMNEEAETHGEATQSEAQSTQAATTVFHSNKRLKSVVWKEFRPIVALRCYCRLSHSNKR